MILSRTNAMFSTLCKESDIQHPLALLFIGKQIYVFQSPTSLYSTFYPLLEKTNETNIKAERAKQAKVVQMGIREIVVAGTVIVIHELDDVYDSVTGRPLTGSWVWDSALVLSKWMFTHVDFQGKSVLEVGAGAGLPGLVAARLGASRVVLTDVKPLLPGLLKNVEANSLTDRVEVEELVWGSDESALRLNGVGKFDIVLMSDVFFDPEEMEGLGRTLKIVCGHSTNIWAASELRPWTGECLNQLTSLGFRVVELPSEPSEPVKGEDSNPFAIFHIALLAEEKCNAES